MSRVSCKKLFEILSRSGLVQGVESVKYLRNCCEAFGKDVRCYVRATDRKQLEQFLAQRGIQCNRDYAPGRSVCDIPVAFFKAWHYDE